LRDFLFHEPLQGTFFDPQCLAPDAAGKPVSRKGTVIDQREFEKLKDEYYTLRGWDVATGYPGRVKLEDLGLKDIADELATYGLLR
jgi:aldehyde:ferredoxin oxidoreductase